MKQELSKKLLEVLTSPLEGNKLRLALEKEIAKMFPYDHHQRSPIKACGLEDDFEFELSHIGTISEAVEKIEIGLSKRQLAYLLLKETVQEKLSRSHRDKPLMPDLSNWIEDLLKKK